MSIKVLFLDVDGVLNNRHTRVTTSDGWLFVNETLVAKLKNIVDATGAKIVLSSTWRIDWDKEDESNNKPCFNELRAVLRKYGLEIMDKTGNFRHTRGQEIHEWFEGPHESVSHMVILDDMDDMGDLNKFLVWTNPVFGLTDEDVQKAIQILNN